MKQNTTFFVAVLVGMSLTGTVANAERRSDEAMRAEAAAAIRQESKNALVPMSETALIEAAGSTDAVKIFVSDGGFAVIAADDHLPAILGVSLKPYDASKANPAFRNWLKAVTRRAEAAEKSGYAVRTTPPDPARFRTEVQPLMSTEWGQGAPYFYMCPMENPSEHLGEYYPDENHCVTGCVATSAAQIIKYYGFPKNGFGSASITMEDVETYSPVIISANFGATTYDYDNMLDIYKDVAYTETQGRAVATLMLHCGVMSDMQYGIDGSGTHNAYAALGMIDHLDYDQDADLADREDYFENEWMELIYTEINENRPVMYSAYTYDEENNELGGHSFVLDGYSPEGLVYVNWGWNGDCNGKYDVAVLDPTDTDWSFEYYQSMIIGLRPNPASVDIVENNTAINASRQGVYTIDGRRINTTGDTTSLPSGFYIINGKKTIVK